MVWMQEDFLTLDRPQNFDKIIANPPFAKNKDIDHIRKMFECLKPKGRIVSMASNHWRNSGNKKEKDFRLWVAGLDADIKDIKAGSFKESGTNVATCIIIINK